MPVLCFAGALQEKHRGVIQKKNAVVGCTTEQDGDDDTGAANWRSINYDTNDWIGAHFTAGASYTACAIKLRLKKYGSPTFKIRAAIYTNNTESPCNVVNCPGTIVGTASEEFDVSVLTTSEALYTLTGMSAALTNTTVYWLVLYYSSGATNYYNDYIQLASKSGGINDITHYGTDGLAWTAGDAYQISLFKTLK